MSDNKEKASMRKALMGIGMTKSQAGYIEEAWGPKFLDMLAEMASEPYAAPFKELADQSDDNLDVSDCLEVGLLLAYMHVNKVENFVDLDFNAYLAELRSKPDLDLRVLSWMMKIDCSHVSVYDPESTKDDLTWIGVPHLLPLCLYWGANVHNLESLIAAKQLFETSDARLGDWFFSANHQASIKICLRDLEETQDGMNVPLDEHHPGNTMKTHLKTFLTSSTTFGLTDAAADKVFSLIGWPIENPRVNAGKLLKWKNDFLEPAFQAALGYPFSQKIYIGLEFMTESKAMKGMPIMQRFEMFDFAHYGVENWYNFPPTDEGSDEDSEEDNVEEKKTE